MATDDNNVQKSASFVYRLTLGDKILTKDDSTALESLELEQKKSVTFQDTDSKQKYDVTLRGVKVNKKIYQPTEIEAELVFTPVGSSASTAPSADAVSALLLQRQVKLELLQMSFDSNASSTGKVENTYTVAENCYVYELDPQLKRLSSGTQMYVKVNIFSMDKLMTLNKYSKAYVARKLGSGILKPESIKFGKQKNAETPLIKTNTMGLRFLKYNETVSYVDKDDNQKNATIPSEFIQPYLVQYNESFYDFLVRTANRCGEFLFFENGALTLGLPYSLEATQIGDFDTVTRQKISADPLVVEAHARDSMKDGVGEVKGLTALNHSAIDKDSTGFPKDAFAEHTVSNAELANDEYFFPLVRGRFSNLSRETYQDGSLEENLMSQAFPIIDTILGNETAGLSGIGATVAKEIFVTEGQLMVTAEMQAISVNQDGRKKYIKPYKSKVEQCEDGKVVQFSSLKEEGWTTIKYYNDIHRHESEQQRQIICIDMGTKFVDVKLGQKIQVDGLKGNFVVIQVKLISEEAWDRNYEKYDAQASDKYSDLSSQKIYAIPSYTDANDDQKEKFIPPVHPVPVIRKAGPQTAFVTDNADPKYQGRVRVAYPWQTLGGDLKTELADAEQRLEKVQEEQQTLEAQRSTLPLKTIALEAELKELKAFVKAGEEERRKMLADLAVERQKKAEDIQTLETGRAAKVKALAEKYNVLAEKVNAMAEGETDMTATIKELMARETQDLDARIEAWKNELEKLSERETNMKAAAAEHDEMKSDTIIARLQKAYSEALTDEKELEEKLEALKEKVEEKNKELDQVKEWVDESYKDMSTPWIRVTMPMATDGGGAFFKPRVGDEVLVNFDSDNVERPYVVGSLYSKNTLTPDEGLLRKAAPVLQRSNLSMQLMSPNGHHITFTDPSGGNSFISSAISPGLGYYASILPGVSTLNAMGEGHKDLAGGIHIGDRYGMYEIEMKSHKRTIDINSPFGTVSINAFSGITISAPNGNVTIKGKNITLEAGNKISMLSGQNIEDPDIGDPEGKGNYLGKKIVGLVDSVLGSVREEYIESIVDFSLIRHVVEVFARPVDGTLLLKSKRFLKLEAGPGNATIRNDRYNASKDIGGLENFYILIQTYIDYICEQVEGYFKDYENLWIDGRVKMNAYFISRGYKRLKKDKAPDILTKLIDIVEWHDIFITYDDTFKLDDGSDRFDPAKFLYMDNAKQIKDETVAAAKEYAKSVVALQAQVDKFTRIFNDAEEHKVDGTSLKDLLKETVNAVFPSAYQDWKKNIDTNDKLFKTALPTDDDLFSMKNKTVVKRKLILAFLYKVGKAPFNAHNKYIKVKYDINYIKDTHVLNQEYYWKRQVQIMDHYWQKSKLWRAIYENTFGALKNKFFDNFRSFDRDIWSDKGEGEILFSDHEDSTLNFEGTGLHEEKAANIGTIDYLKEKLMGIK